jgi:hypothetical protein
MPTNKKSFTPAQKGTGSFINLKASLATENGEVVLNSFGDDADVRITMKIEAEWFIDLIKEHGAEAVMQALVISPVSIKLEGEEAAKVSKAEKAAKLFG